MVRLSLMSSRMERVKHPHTEDYELTVDGNGLGAEIEQWAADGVIAL